MIAILALAVLGQTPTTLSSEEIMQRLELPVTLRTDPTRLANALDQIGAQVGVRFQCDAALQPAVVVVGVRGKPAKEILKHLVDGIGAGSYVYAGTLHVGMRVPTDEQIEKQREAEIRAINASIESRAKQLKIDEALDPTIAPRTASQMLVALQAPFGEYRLPYQTFYQASAQAPSMRATVGLMRAVGGENLRLDDEKSKVITLKNLAEDRKRAASEALDKLYEEQGPWADAFSQVMKLSANNPNSYMSDDLLTRSVSIKGSKPNDFRLIIAAMPWGRSATMQILSGGDVLFESVESLPRQRVYTNPGGESFHPSRAREIKVELGERVAKVETLRRMSQGNKAVEYDWNLLKLVADPNRHEPISFTRAQPMADVAEKLNLNLVTYLGDGLINHLAYYQYNDSSTTVTGEQVLSLSSYGAISGLRKKDDWLIGYCSNPEQYLSTQASRPALGRFLNLALKPGALSFDQFLNARKELGNHQFQIAYQLARFIRPGFDSLNPVNLETLDMMAMMRPGQLNQARTSGITIASLPPELETKLRQFMGFQRRRNIHIPDDSIDAPPTLDEIRKARLFLDQTSKVGTLTWQQPPQDTVNTGRLLYSTYTHFNFQDIENYRRYTSAAQVAQTFHNRLVWPARMDTYMFRIELQRRRTQAFGTSQYITDITQPPLTPNQGAELVQRYLGG